VRRFATLFVAVAAFSALSPLADAMLFWLPLYEVKRRRPVGGCLGGEEEEEKRRRERREKERKKKLNLFKKNL